MNEFEWHIELNRPLRRSEGRAGHEIYNNPSFSLCYAEKSCVAGGRKIELTATEYLLLEALSSNPNFVISSEELSQTVWSEFDLSRKQSLKVYVNRLRDKLGASSENPIIENVRGHGYKLLDSNSCMHQNGNSLGENIILFPIRLAV